MSESLVDISLGDMDGHAKICSLTPEGVPCQTSGDEATQVSSESNEMIDRVADKLCRVRMIDT